MLSLCAKEKSWDDVLLVSDDRLTRGMVKLKHNASVFDSFVLDMTVVTVVTGIWSRQDDQHSFSRL